jgi:aryl sulfotransferase
MTSRSLAIAWPDPALPTRERRYETATQDSIRWDAYRPREGDIIVTTAPKCGTTWTQMLCALLIHGPTLPAPLSRISPEFDRLAVPVEALMDELDAQVGPRIIKTHTPLDGLPYFSEVRYLHCARDPRDAFLSMVDNMQNLSAVAMTPVRERLSLPENFAFPTDPNAFFPVWMTTPVHSWMEDGFPTGSVFHAARAVWPYRRLENLHLLHYRDLRCDLEAEMRRLADFLGIRVSHDCWPALVSAAGFPAMRARADEVAPGAHLGDWTSNHAFFKCARLDEWRDVLTAENQALYEELAPQRGPPALRAWLEGGRKATDLKQV